MTQVVNRHQRVKCGVLIPFPHITGSHTWSSFIDHFLGR